jgi:hypothetical protein
MCDTSLICCCRVRCLWSKGANLQKTSSVHGGRCIASLIVTSAISCITSLNGEQHMGVAGLHDPILAAAGEGLVSFVFSCQVRVGLTMVLLLLSLLLFKSAIS